MAVFLFFFVLFFCCCFFFFFYFLRLAEVRIVTAILFCRLVYCHMYSKDPQRYKVYLLTCAPNEDSNQPAHPHSQISLPYPHEEALQPLLSKMRPEKILLILCECTDWPESSMIAYTYLLDFLPYFIGKIWVSVVPSCLLSGTTNPSEKQCTVNGKNVLSAVSTIRRYVFWLSGSNNWLHLLPWLCLFWKLNYNNFKTMLCRVIPGPKL